MQYIIAKKIRKTMDGMKTYSYDELKLGSNGGGILAITNIKCLLKYSKSLSLIGIIGTPLCPFDCDCCF